MQTVAVVLERPEHLALRAMDLTEVGTNDIVVDVEWSGISSGTERLLWTGRMPPFPGLAYPLVPGYETVGRVKQTSRGSGLHEGDRVFVPGANCFGDVRGLFGGAASRLVVPAARVVPIEQHIGENGVLIALAATAYHAIAGEGARLPELIVGHGIVGRLLARITLALGGEAPTVWETNPLRRSGTMGYDVIDPTTDERRNYGAIVDASFTFPPAFMREARIRIAAEWARSDIEAVTDLISSGKLNLDGLITHFAAPETAPDAYRTAFTDPHCLKMVLDWRHHA